MTEHNVRSADNAAGPIVPISTSVDAPPEVVGTRPKRHEARASAIAVFGFALSVISLTAPFGLDFCRREIEKRATRYAEALALPPERFSVIRFGTWLSFAAFSVITVGWRILMP